MKPKTHGGQRKGAGRPSTDDPRDTLVMIKMTEAEHKHLKDWSAKSDTPLSTWMRETCLRVTGWK